ncbi:MAG: S8 family serine peptidase [Alteromonadaceae bacterium]|nr:S8 family serine peptidase [Alteromonadaceae bacterium]
MAAKAAGSTMVFAAGNDGPGSGTIGSPGTSGEVLTVGGSTTDRFTANFFSLAGSDVQNTLALTAGPVAVSEDITLPIVYAGSVDEANFEGCTAWENTEAFTGAMALISRGSCTFNDKIVFAQDAGASGVIIFNNQPDAGPIGMAVDDSLLTVPAAMIGTNAGLATVEALGADAEAMATLTASVGVEDSMYNASSRGANADPEVFKPNLIAPGVQIFSGESPVAPGHEGENFSLKNGTSMASPHVAGAAALIKQMNPDWSAEQIMSAVTSTAVRDTLVSEDLESTPDAFDYGAGRLDIYRAANAQLTFSELGLATNDCFLSCEWTLEVTNTADSDISVTVDSMIGQGYELSVSPADATLTAGSTTELTITVDTTNGQAFDTWVFGGIEWNDGNSETPEYFIPIAVNAVETEAPGFLSTSASQTVVEAGESVTLGASIDNIAILEPITLNAEFGEGFVLDADGVSATINGEAQTVTVDSDAGTASWTGTLGAADFSITPDTKPADDLAVFGVPGYFPVSALLGTAPLECSSSCDDTFITVDLDTPIPYLGDEYTTMHVSSNGFVVLGDDATGANFSLTQPLPSTDAPNNVIAPLWMDLDLDGGDGVGGGTVSVATNMNLNDFGCGPACGNYVVVEWQDAEIYQVEGEVYSFQLWLDKDTGDSYFYYGAVGSFPAMLNQFGLGMTVGAENETGQVGITQARIESDNTLTGTLPAAGDIWKLSVGAGESLEFSAAGSLAERDELIGDNVELTEDGTASFDVLANDVVEPIINTITVSSGMQSARAFKTLNYDFADFDASSLAISTAPMNGTAEVVEGSVQYTPVADYNGADSFEYSVMDDGEMYTATVNVNVTPVNDAPVINAINVPATTVEGGFVTVSVDASDIDGDNLTVTINGNEGASASLLAPQVSRDGGSLDITVTVSDGIETVTQTTAVTVNDAPKGSGSMAWYSLLLLPLTWLRRRKQA